MSIAQIMKVNIDVFHSIREAACHRYTRNRRGLTQGIKDRDFALLCLGNAEEQGHANKKRCQ